MKRKSWMLLFLLLIVMFAFNAQAEDKFEVLQNNLNTVWTLIAAFMVFIMQAGFAMVEMGMTRGKNAINIIMKNLMDFSVGSLLFFFVGFGLMFGVTNGMFGTTDFMLSGVTGEHWNYTFILFQTVFAATAATIVSGAMAERTIFTSYLLYSIVITGLIYPISGSWAWGSLLNGNGWLENLSTGAFTDFAGSTVVHSLGGWLALAGALVIGPRKGKYGPNGEVNAIPGHNIPFAALGVFILWFAWFGFNAGSTTTGDASIGRIAFITNISAVSGCIMAMLASWIWFKKPDVTMSLNGALAGLVGITAGCATLDWKGALITGIISGVLVVASVIFIDQKLKIDDPVGAVSVHGVCGAWGTLACGLFNAEKALGIGEANTGLFYGGGANQLISQLIGVASFMAWGLITGFILFSVIKKIVGLRVTEDEEYVGLDIEEHGLEAYYETR
jgi:Amt family ammonium transporter